MTHHSSLPSVGRPAGKIDRGLVEVGDLALGVGGVDRGRDRGEQFLQALLALAELRFGALRSVMSRAIFEAPTIVPSPSRIGETVSEMSTRLPSLRRRTVS